MMTEADQRFLRRILMVLVAAALFSGSFAGLQSVQASPEIFFVTQR